MTTLILARHGETDWNRENRFQGHADPPLNDLGREQSAELAARLAGEGIARVYTSPLRRASETAEIVARELGLEVEHLEGLREIDVGAWSGLTRDEVAVRFPDEYALWLDRAPHGYESGETYAELAGASRSGPPFARGPPPDGDRARRHPRRPVARGAGTRRRSRLPRGAAPRNGPGQLRGVPFRGRGR